jgi:CheY-like chemotaxis protein
MKKAILCVDDEIIILKSLRTQIKNYFGDRYKYEIAESAEEAWEVIEELVEGGIKIMVIVSDWLMPGLKGDEFLIQVHERYPQIVTVMLTGQADQEAIQRAENGANLLACLHKPWTQEELIYTIVAGLENSE